MVASKNADVAAILQEEITPPPEMSDSWDFIPLNRNAQARKIVIDVLTDTLKPLNANFLVGYEGHMGPVILAADILDVGFDRAYKQFADSPSPLLTGVYIQLDALRAAEAKLGEPLRIVFIDDLLNTGEAAERAIVELRKFFEVRHAVFLSEVISGAGRKRLQSIGVTTHSLTTFSPENSFGPAPNDPVSDRSRSAGYAGDPEKREHHRSFPFSMRPFGSTSYHRQQRPGF